jgi:hypothetical protein
VPLRAQETGLISYDGVAVCVFVRAKANGSRDRVMVHVPDTSGSRRNGRDQYDLNIGLNRSRQRLWAVVQFQLDCRGAPLGRLDLLPQKPEGTALAKRGKELPERP